MLEIDSKQKNDHEMFGSILAEPKNDCLEVLLPKYLRDQGWANSIGVVQSEVKNYAEKEDVLNFKKAVFDFTACRWVDPLPLMSMLLEIITTRDLGVPVEVKLPAPDSGPLLSEKGFYHESPNRLLRYLAQEGFLDCLDHLAKIDNRILNTSKPAKGWNGYRELKVRPSYEDAQCIPMSLFNVPVEGDEFAKESVDTLLIGVDSRLEAKIAPQTRERLISRLRVALQEVLHNAQEHAYETDSISRPLVIYVRYRTGGINRDFSGKQIFQESVKEENKHCPRLRAEWLADRLGCLELFVLDRGIGMVRSFEKNPKNPLSHKYKFNEVIQKTFGQGISAKSQRETRYGGLHLLHNLLIGGYLRALEGNLWVGHGIPLQRKTEGAFRHTDFPMAGLAMHFRIGWRTETDQGDEWAKFEQGQKSEVWQELRLSEKDSASSFEWFEQKTVIDERFGTLKQDGAEGDWILWLVHPHRMKWDILTFIQNKVAPLATGGTVLIIADIPSYEAKIYEAALEGFQAKGDENWPLKFSRIILVTNRWRFATVDYALHGAQHGFSMLHNDFAKLRVKPPPILPAPKNFRLGIVRWLKWHDSRRVWDEVKQGGTMFIPEKVAWGNDEAGKPKIIAGYLDFPQTTHNDLCLSVYRAALTRVLGILPLDLFSMHPLDRLIMTVLREIFAEEVYEQPCSPSPENRLVLGSVMVSGTTMDASVKRSIDLHFFVHCSSPLRGKHPALLFWLFPQKEVDEKDATPRLARIGKTSSVAPEGWKSFEVPRFDSTGICVGTRTPQQTYQDWQSPSPVIVKAGHWVYEGHHDFITVNIASAVEAAFLAKNELARFLATRILSFIGITKEHVDANWHRLLKVTSEENPAKKNEGRADYGLLIYRSHPSTDSVVRKLLSLLTPKGREMALERIFSILPVRMRWSGSTLLIPPLVRENIKGALSGGDQPRPLLLFDDAAITGRTLHDLRASLSAIGAEEIRTMVIANRLRQPADGHGSSRVDYYWRLDVPVMGREGNCPLCHALQLAEAFSCSLATSNAKQEIKDWRQRWGARSPIDNWSGGVHPFPLMKAERGTKYCYRANPDTTSTDDKHLTEIDLIRSTGLTIHVSELHAMTGRDDYCQKKIKEHNESEIKVELAASQLLLFGNEFDMDIRIELVQTLIRELCQLKGDPPHASLAALAAIGELGLLDNETKGLAAKIVHNGLHLKTNYATKVLLAYLASEELLEQNSYAYKIGSRMLKSEAWPVAERLNALFLETLSVRGNDHSEDIPLLIRELSQSTTIDEMRIRGAMDSLDHLNDIVEGLGGVARKDVKSDYKSRVERMREVCWSAKELLTAKPIKDKMWRIDTQQCLISYIEAMKVVADSYFHCIPSASDYWKNPTFENTLSQLYKNMPWKMESSNKKVNQGERIIEISTAGERNFDPEAGEVWIAWPHAIPGIIKDLYLNAVYASQQSQDPWAPHPDKVADLWVRINYGKNAVEVILANSVKSTPEIIFSKLKNRWSSLENIGGSVTSVDVSPNVFGVQVRIPYAGYLHNP